MHSIESFTMKCNYDNKNFVAENGAVYYEEAYACYGDAEYKCDPRRFYCEGVERKHKIGKKRDDVRLIIFKHDHMMDYVPEGFGFFFPNTEVFSCGGCHLHYIEKTDLRQFPKLKVLNLYENRLRYLPGDLFEYIPQLEYFTVSNNPIKSIGKGFFNHSPKLKQFYFITECHSSDKEMTLQIKIKSVISGCESKTKHASNRRKSDQLIARPNPIIECEKEFVMREEITVHS